MAISKEMREQLDRELGDRVKSVEAVPGRVRTQLGQVPKDDPKGGWVNPDEKPDFYIPGDDYE